MIMMRHNINTFDDFCLFEIINTLKTTKCGTYPVENKNIVYGYDDQSHKWECNIPHLGLSYIMVTVFARQKQNH